MRRAHLVVLPKLRLRGLLPLEEQPHGMFYINHRFPAALHDDPEYQLHLHLLEEEMYHPAKFFHVLLIEEIQVPRTTSRRIRAHLVM